MGRSEKMLSNIKKVAIAGAIAGAPFGAFLGGAVADKQKKMPAAVTSTGHLQVADDTGTSMVDISGEKLAGLAETKDQVADNMGTSMVDINGEKLAGLAETKKVADNMGSSMVDIKGEKSSNDPCDKDQKVYLGNFLYRS